MLVFLILVSNNLAAQPREISTHRTGNIRVQSFFTNHRQFQVPYQVNPSGRDIVEVRVFQSADLSKPWSLLHRLDQTKGHFRFDTKQDGVVWFSIQSLDRDQRLWPPGAPQPSLKIHVDTQKPELQINVNTDAAGRIVTSIDTSDPNLHLASLKIQYRSTKDNNASWKDTGFLNKNPQLTSRYRDQIAWWPPRGLKHLAIRVTSVDRAGNQTQAEQLVAVSGQGAPNSGGPTSSRARISEPQLPSGPFPGSASKSSDQYFQNVSTSVGQTPRQE